MYKLLLIYDPEPASEFLKDVYTLCTVSALLADSGIDCCVTSSTCLAFDTEKDRFLASLYLSEHSHFRVVYFDE